jgi:hypothetical protein
MSRLQNVQVTKRPFYKRSRLQNVQDTKRPVFVNLKTCLKKPFSQNALDRINQDPRQLSACPLVCAIWFAPLCREGYFILPYNELAIAQGPKIQQKNKL